MEEAGRKDDAHWDHVMESLDLQFARVTDIGHDQQRIQAQLDYNAEVMVGYGQTQELLTKKVDATGQAVAKLTTNFMRQEEVRHPPSPRQEPSGEHGHHRLPLSVGHTSSDHHGSNLITPLSCPFHVSLVCIPKYGRINVWTIFIFAMYLTTCGLLLLLYILMIMLLSGSKCIS